MTILFYSFIILAVKKMFLQSEDFERAYAEEVSSFLRWKHPFVMTLIDHYASFNTQVRTYVIVTLQIQRKREIDMLCLEDHFSIFLLSYSISSGALGSPTLLLSYSMIALALALHNT